MEGVSGPAEGATANTSPIVDAEDPGFVPMHQLPPAERAHNKAQMNHILDMLEEEERLEEERSAARERRQRREELEQRKTNVKADLDRLKTLKDMQKKMGKALLRNMADAREKEEEVQAQQVREDLEREEVRKSRKPRKSVSWAELPKSEKLSATASVGEDTWEAGPSRGLPMRPVVVERFPTRPVGTASPPPPVADSDDESDPQGDSDEGDEIHSDRVPSPPLSDDTGDGDEDEPGEGHESEDEFDIDAVQHQREIALAYFEKRNKIGADAARAMSAHSHEPNDEDEWDQEASFSCSLLSGVLTEAPKQEVPLDATLAGPRPKPPQSKFKSERLTQAYSTHVPSTTPSTSLGTSVLPSSSSALRSAVRTGRLEGDELVDYCEGEVNDDDDDARARAFMDALRRGDVTNAGAAENADALVAALESAYGPPPPASSSAPTVPHPQPAPAPTPARQHKKDSKFKLVRAAAPPRALADDEGPRVGAAALAPPNGRGAPRPSLLTSETVFERKRQPAPSQSHPPPPPPDIAGSPIIDSPSFPAPLAGARAGEMTIIDSPSFPPPLSSHRPTRPPTVLPTSSLVRESGGRSGGMALQRPTEVAVPGPGPGKKISRFKAQQTES